MIRATAAVLFAFFLSAPVFGQSDRFDVSIRGWIGNGEDVTRVPVNTTVIYDVHVRSVGLVRRDAELVVDIPGRVTQVSDFVADCTGPGTRPIRCGIPVPDAYELDAFFGAIAVLETPGTYTAVARVGDHVATHTIEVVDLPSLRVVAYPSGLRRRIEPSQTVPYESFLASTGATATNVRWTHTLPAGGTFAAVRAADPELQCSVTPQEVVCTRASVPPHLNLDIELDVVAPDRKSGGSVVMRVQVTKNEPDFNPADDLYDSVTPLVRQLVVSNTNDEGSGSLRQALLESHTFCASAPCLIAFDIPGTPEGGSFVIRPKSELPEVRGIVKIDGATQDGARIAIDGAQAGAAHGLVLGKGCEIQVLDLTITGFHWPGIQVQRGRFPAECGTLFDYLHPATLIARNHISNNYRGVMVVDTGEITVRDNTIASNRRAGIFIERTDFAEVTHNRVERNGASGMFFDVGRRNRLSPVMGGAVVTDNVISGHPQWGITRTNNGEVQIQRNSIFGNQHPAIDLNLDFETPNRPQDDYFDIPNKPVLLSASYDPAQQATVVTFRLDVAAGHPLQIDFYANDPAGVAARWQMQEWVGVHVTSGAIHSEVSVTIPRDLRGKLLVATTSRGRFTSFAKPPDIASQSHTLYTVFDTSEPSNAVTVH